MIKYEALIGKHLNIPKYTLKITSIVYRNKKYYVVSEVIKKPKNIKDNLKILSFDKGQLKIVKKITLLGIELNVVNWERVIKQYF